MHYYRVLSHFLYPPITLKKQPMKTNNNKHIKTLKRASENYVKAIDYFMGNWTPTKRSNERLLQIIPGVVKKLNQLMTEMGGIPAKYLGHYPGGVEKLIKDILRQQRAGWQGSRADIIKSAMYSEEIVSHTKYGFAGWTTRYGQQTVRNSLRDMVVKNQLGQIILTRDEDVDRESTKPRAKYYLLP